ncbi:STAS domain-containing protein [Streptomyces sp. NPDC059893]|uniref:STAS domain-containing protein n=1 Tax=Streptomyces sp. NPDC059893 TaxID=3346990 RepID=UPI003650E93B
MSGCAGRSSVAVCPPLFGRSPGGLLGLAAPAGAVLTLDQRQVLPFSDYLLNGGSLASWAEPVGRVPLSSETPDEEGRPSHRGRGRLSPPPFMGPGPGHQRRPSGNESRLPLSPGGLILAVSGEVDLESVEPWKLALTGAANDDDRTVVADLSAVVCADAAIINALLRVRLSLGRRLRIAALSWPVLRLVQILGVDHAFALRAGLQEALRDAPAPEGGVSSSAV